MVRDYWWTKKEAVLSACSSPPHVALRSLCWRAGSASAERLRTCAVGGEEAHAERHTRRKGLRHDPISSSKHALKVLPRRFCLECCPILHSMQEQRERGRVSRGQALARSTCRVTPAGARAWQRKRGKRW